MGKPYFGCKWNYGAPITWLYKEKVTLIISPLSLLKLWANARGPSARGDVDVSQPQAASG